VDRQQARTADQSGGLEHAEAIGSDEQRQHTPDSKQRRHA
jgi:hypothetical protein